MSKKKLVCIIVSVLLSILSAVLGCVYGINVDFSDIDLTEDTAYTCEYCPNNTHGQN